MKVPIIRVGMRSEKDRASTNFPPNSISINTIFQCALKDYTNRINGAIALLRLSVQSSSIPSARQNSNSMKTRSRSRLPT